MENPTPDAVSAVPIFAPPFAAPTSSSTLKEEEQEEEEVAVSTSTPSRLPPPALRVSVSFRNGDAKTLERFFSARARFGTPDREQAELFRVFQSFDANSDGRLSVDEIASSLARLGIIVPLDDLHALLDPHLHGDGELGLDFEDFRALYRSLCQDADEPCQDEDLQQCDRACLTPNGKIVEADLLSAFDLFDANRDGYITVTELQSVLIGLGFKEATSLEACKSMIARVDTDEDGRVNFQEFKDMMRSVED